MQRRLNDLVVVSVLFSVPSVIIHELVFGMFRLPMDNELIL